MKVLLIRSAENAHFYAPLAQALLRSERLDVMQYPVFPEDKKTKVGKLFNPDQAWNALHTQVIETRAELKQRLSAGDFDLVLLADNDAQLFRRFDIPRYRWKIGIECAVRWLKGEKKLARTHWHYENAMPWSLEEFGRNVHFAAVEICDAACMRVQNRRILEASTVFFKRELPYDRFFMYYPDRPAPWAQRRLELLPHFKKVHAIPMGIEDDKYFALKIKRSQVQDIDLFVSGAITNTLRQEALERIKALAVHNDWNIVIEDHVPFETYCDLVSRSKVTLSIAGSRWECFRHYEAVALGSLPLMNVPTIDAHWWKDAPRDLFFQNHFDDFERRIEALLNDGELRQHCRNYLENMVENKLLLSRVVDFIFAISLQSLQKTRET